MVAGALLFGRAAGVLGADAPEAVVLRAGESRVLMVPEVTRVAVGQPLIADVRVLSPGEVLVNGKSEGQTTLLFWPSSGKVIERAVQVLCPSPAFSDQDVRQLVGEGQVTVRTVSGYLVVEGHPTAEGRIRLSRLTALLGPKLVDLTETPRETTGAASGPPAGASRDPTSASVPLKEGDLTAVTALVRRTEGEGVSLLLQDGKVLVEGRVTSEAGRQKALRLVEAFFPGRVVDAVQVAETPGLFSIKARLIEVDRQAARELGLEWPAAVGVGEPAPPGGLRVEPLARLEALLVKVKLLEESGKAKILAEPSMTVLDGQEGSFLAGGQIPVPLEVDGRTTVEWKEYGVRLKVRPTLLPSGQIRLAARPEVSTLDWANGVRLGSGTVPALRSRWAETAVEQKSGDTLILAGLSLTEETDHQGRVPGLAEIPLLGAVFRTGRGAKRHTELTILLTTTLVAPLPPAEETPDGP